MAANANLYAVLEARAARHPEAIAFSLPGGAQVSYGEFGRRVAQMANALAARGVVRGDRVMVQVEKSFENVLLYYATAKIGAIYNPLNTAYTAAELDYFIGDAKPKLLVVDPGKMAALKPIAEKAGAAHVDGMATDGSGSLATLAGTQADAHATADMAADDLAALLYTSGTTGRSKGAMITHRNLSSNALTLVDYWGFSEKDVLLHALPIFHVHGLFVALNTTLLAGGRIIWQPKFDLAAVMTALPGSTVMMGVPTFYTRLLGDKSFG